MNEKWFDRILVVIVVIAGLLLLAMTVGIIVGVIALIKLVF